MYGHYKLLLAAAIGLLHLNTWFNYELIKIREALLAGTAISLYVASSTQLVPTMLGNAIKKRLPE